MTYSAEQIRIVIAMSICREAVADHETLESLDVDSLTRLELMQDLDEKFNIDLDNDAVDAWETVADVVRDVQNMLNASKIGKNSEYGMLNDTSQLEAINAAYGQEIPQIAGRFERSAPVINRIERDDVAFFEETMGDAENDDLLMMYQRIATKSAIYPGKGTPFGLMYAALGLAEAGEVQNKVKKAFRDDNIMEFGSPAPDDPFKTVPTFFHELLPHRKAQIIKELGGALWYIAAVCDEIGATMSEVALQNLEELCSRGERGTLRGDGDNR